VEIPEKTLVFVYIPIQLRLDTGNYLFFMKVCTITYENYEVKQQF